MSPVWTNLDGMTRREAKDEYGRYHYTYWIRNEASRKEKGATDVDDL